MGRIQATSTTLAFLVTNRRNWTFAQMQTYSPTTPPRPSGAGIPRQLQFGVRARF